MKFTCNPELTVALNSYNPVSAFLSKTYVSIGSPTDSNISHLRIKSKEIIPGCLMILKKKDYRKIMILKAFYNNIIIQERQNLFYHLISIFLETINPNFNIIKTKKKIERLKNEIFKPK